MRYLLDTNVISELRRKTGSANVKRWVAAQNVDDLTISVITVIEIETGILRLKHRDELAARKLTTWFENRVLKGFDGRILPLDLAAARRVAPLHVPDQAPQHDALIAGAALAAGLTVATRNTKDFTRTGVQCINPWEIDL